METVIVILFSIGIILLIISFFKKDRVAKLEEEFEQATLNQLQDIYQLKKKIKVLEEELLIQQPSSYLPQSGQTGTGRTAAGTVNEILKSQVISLYRQGVTLEQIERQSALSRQQIQAVIDSLPPKELER
ncbi:hypothetical protein [Bacillus massiliglaciei]|uniref:hypothetical protein n=1 Tax=Bacillus massiliglaciei TaxID=1816693 RepID=UPI000B17E3BA|nr:hypothetical protein [Bacillus massiliglaciei]